MGGNLNNGGGESTRFCPINVKTAKLIWSKFFVATHRIGLWIIKDKKFCMNKNLNRKIREIQFRKKNGSLKNTGEQLILLLEKRR